MNLDLEHPAPFWPLIESDSESTERVLTLCSEQNHFITALDHNGTVPNSLRSKLEVFIRYSEELVTSISTYHGCRVSNEDDYRLRGILRRPPEAMVDECKKIFGQECETERVVESLERRYPGYTAHNASRVFCVRSIAAVKKIQCNHPKGSELIRAVAKELGPGAEELYQSSGKKCFIEARTPRDFYSQHAEPKVSELLRALFSHWLTTKLKREAITDSREGGITFDTDLSPKMVHAFHYQ